MLSVKRPVLAVLGRAEIGTAPAGRPWLPSGRVSQRRVKQPHVLSGLPCRRLLPRFGHIDDLYSGKQQIKVARPARYLNGTSAVVWLAECSQTGHIAGTQDMPGYS